MARKDDVSIDDLFGPTTIPYEIVELSAIQARDLRIDPEFDPGERLSTAIDDAQGRVFTGDHPVAYVILRITQAGG